MTSPQRRTWLRVAAEVVIVVGSVLLAFGIQAARDNRQERELRYATLEGLLADFESSRENLAVIVAGNRWYLGSQEALMVTLRGPAGSQALVPDSLLLGAVLYPTYNPPRASVEMALASGRLTTSRDQPLRRLLAKWLRELDDTSEDELLVQQVVESRIAPLLLATPGLAEVLAGLPTRFNTQISEAVGDSQRLVERNGDLLGLIALRVLHTRGALREQLRLSRTQDEIVAHLRASLDRVPGR